MPSRAIAEAGPLPTGKGLDARLQELRPGAFLTTLQQQSWAYWLLCSYVFVEYVRPQSVWPAIDVLPWGVATLALTLVAYVVEVGKRRVRKRTILDGGLVFFSAVLLFSTSQSTYPSWSHEGLEIYANWILLYVFVAGLVTNPRRYFVFLALFLLWSFKMAQFGTRSFIGRGFAFADWGAVGGPGWFHNSGEFAIQMCVFLPMAYYFFVGLKPRLPAWLFWSGFLVVVGSAALSLPASSSRGGQLGGAVVCLVILAQSRHRVRGLIIAALAATLIWSITPPEQKARFAEMGEDNTSQSRLTYWRDGIEIMNEYPIAGIGYEAWEPYYRRHYNPNGELPHNIFVEAGSELGYPGLFGFVFLIVGTAVVNLRTRRLAEGLTEWGGFLKASAYGLDAALVGYLVSGFFVTVLFYPYFWANLAFTAALYESTRREARRQRRGQLRQHRPRATHPAGRVAGPLPRHAASTRAHGTT